MKQTSGKHGIAILLMTTVLLSMVGCANDSVINTRPAHTLTLAENGQPLLPVCISSAASDKTKHVADELAAYLSRITGGKFEVRVGDGATGIVLGTLAEFPDPELIEPLAIRDTCDGREAFAIRTETGRVRLIGATELGTSHAAFRLLEELGCRWFFPAPEWEVIPSRPTLTVSLDLNDRPAILSRRIWWGYGFFDAKARADYEAWARHNRMAASRTIYAGHAWQSIIEENSKVFADHPEYLALVKGKREGPQLCVSNPAVRQIASDWAMDYLKRNPNADMVSLETSDGDGHCECDACRKLGSISDRVFGLANEVARRVAHEMPGKMVGLYAYNDHCEPPSFALEPNVYVQMTAGFIRGKYTFDELMERWPKVASNFGFYEYLSVWLWDFDMPPGGRGANVKYIRDQIRRYAAIGATSLDCESGNNWGLHGRGYYIANKLMWNPKADLDTLLDDFYQQAFGPAAEPMRRYYERLDPGNDPLLSEHLLALALRDLDDATRLAAGHPEVITRIDQLKQYQHYVRLRWEHDRAADKAMRRDLALAALRHVYRARYSYMNHWEAMRQGWTPVAATEFNEPSWSFHQKDNPWRVEEPLSHDETDRLFREDMDRFQPQAVEERQFSSDLVPSGIVTDTPAASSQRFQNGCRYALYSRAGEPLSLTITTGIIAWYRDRAEAHYTVTSADGKKIASERLPQDGAKHLVNITVPSAGLYWMEFDDQGAAWGIEVPAGVPVTIDLRHASQHHLGHMQRMYFYVPKGTRRIDYYWQGGPHQVRGPDGKPIAKVETSGRFVSIPVPEGTDGYAWSLSELALGQLRFFNIPNYLAGSPNALLLPREVVNADRPASNQATSGK